MQLLLALGVSLLAAVSPNQSPQPSRLSAGSPVNVTFVKATFEDALSTIAKVSGVMIEIDQSVSEAVRREPIANTPIRLHDASVEKTIDWLTSTRGLSYTVVDGASIRIFKKA